MPEIAKNNDEEELLKNQPIIIDFLKQKYFQEHDLELKPELKSILIEIFQEIQLTLHKKQQIKEKLDYKNQLLQEIFPFQLPNNSEHILQDQREFIEYFLNIAKDNILKILQFLNNFGYDLYLQKTHYQPHQSPSLLPRSSLIHLLEYLETQACKTSHQVLQYNTHFLRFPTESSLNYPQPPQSRFKFQE